jgi:DNA-binding transcriptional MerR regulator
MARAKAAPVARFTVQQAVTLTGFRSPFMLDYLKRSGVVKPSHSADPGRGRRRYYSFGDLVVLRALGHLLERGIAVRRLKTAIDRLRLQFKHLDQDATITRYLFTDGKRVLLHDQPNGWIDLSSGGQYTFAFMVDLVASRDDVVARMRDAA